jgi:hypothetical protein
VQKNYLIHEFCALARALEENATAGGSTAENTGTTASVSISEGAPDPERT